MAARFGAPSLHGIAGDEQDQGAGGVHVEEWETVAELIPAFYLTYVVPQISKNLLTLPERLTKKLWKNNQIIRSR